MKRGILLIISILLLTGCTRLDLNTKDYTGLVLDVIKSDNSFTNEVGYGYKFFIPKGLRIIEDIDNNQIFRGVNTKLYMYVDIISYYYNISSNYDVDTNNCYYYDDFDYNGKSGFICIEKENDIYLLRLVYNYAKIEAYVDEYNLNTAITYSTILLRSINYNDVVIKNLLDDTGVTSSEITYNIDKPDNANSNFSQLLEESVVEEEQEEVSLPDD